MNKIVNSLLIAALLTACASSPFDMQGVNRGLTPQMAQSSDTYQGQKVVWGGIIIRTEVLKQLTQIEVLAFPVDQNGEPDRRATAQGRFLINQPGFLDPADYAAGRWISVLGEISHLHLGKVGEAKYTFPVVVAKQLHLWSDEAPSDSRIRFGVGVGIHL